MNTAMERILARRPWLYLRALRWLGRGSLEKKIFLGLVRDGDVVFDVGANRGYFTRLFSCVVGPGGAVHAFEPVPPTFERLRETMKSAALFSNFTLNNFALGDSEGSVELLQPGDDDGQASMRVHGSGSWVAPGAVHSHRCRVITLDVCAAGFARLDFVKCDVEGAELLVVNGAAAAFLRLSPILFLEVNPAWTVSFGYTPDDLVSRLREYGYDTFLLAGEKLVPLETAKFGETTNLLCGKAGFHKERFAGLQGINP